MSYRKPAHRPLLTSVKDVLADLRLRRPLGQLAAAGLGALPLAALANPTGGQVVGGSATINTPNANATVVNQTSQNAAINWQQFSVGANQYVQFIQPNSSAVVLNRVVGSNPSSIFGNITANGQVFLINPNGILFAPGASLDVAGLVASTQDISTSDFMAGRYNFTKAAGAPDATVVNQGTLSANGGYVVLAGDYVENDGVINAQSGRVYLAAGNSATLSLSGNQLISYTVDGATLARLAGVSNTGQIVADGGAVVMTGDVANALTATAVNNSGLITAHSIKNESGTIVLAATGAELVNSGTLDASATQAGVAGGTIVVHGGGTTKLMPTSVITTAGDGAKGGFIDLSGHNLAVRGSVDAGKGGELLLDPTKINIVSGAVNGLSTIGTNSIGTGFIATQLNAGINVAIVAGSSIVNVGHSARTITATGGAGRLSFDIGTINCATGICVGGSPIITHGILGKVDLAGLTVNINGAFDVIDSHGAVTVGDVTAQGGIGIRAGTISVLGNLNAGNGSLQLSGESHSSGPGKVIVATGKTLSAKNMSLNVFSSYGGTISIGTLHATNSANIGITDFGSTAHLDKISLGAMNAPRININEFGKDEVVTTGALTAVNSAGAAGITISVTDNGGLASVTVNGPVTVSGKTSATGNTGGRFDLPLPAHFDISMIGSGNVARNITVNGPVSVTAFRGAYSASSFNESNPGITRKQSGTGGMAGMFISAVGSQGAVSFANAVTVKGADAVVSVQAHNVSMKNITVTGSGHTVSRSSVPRSSSTRGYSSSNSAGQAILAIGGINGGSRASTAASVKTGNITVSGKGIAGADLFASNVSAGNIAVTTLAASGKITKNQGAILNCGTSGCGNDNSADFYHNVSRVPLSLGSIHLGGAGVQIAAGPNTGGGSGGPQAAVIKTGTISANGVGGADIRLDGKSITTLGLSATATKGTLKGSGSSHSGGNGSNTYKHTFSISGGGAEVKIRSGNSGSRSSGVLTQNGGPVTINGNVTVSGPAADVNIKGATIKVGGALTVTGSGGAVTSDTVFTGAGPSFHTHFVGTEPTSLNLQGAASGSVSVAGKTTIKGPGMIGAIMVAGSVKLNGFSGSASATRNYSILDTRVSATTQSFTAGSVGIIIADVTAVAGTPAFTAATDVGDVNIKAAGNVDLPTQLTISGNLNVQAGGSIVGSSNGVVTRFNTIDNSRPRAGSNSASGGPSPGILPHLAVTANNLAFNAKGGSIMLDSAALHVGTGNLTLSAAQNVHLTSAALGAGSVHVTASGSIDANGITVNASKIVQFFTDKSVTLDGVSITAGAFIADAVGNISDGSVAGGIDAGAMAMVAGGNIFMNATALKIGTGSVSSVHGDTALLEGLAAAGLSPAVPNPNGTFIAGGAVSLGSLTMTGDYLLLEGGTISLLGPVTVPTGTLVQVAPFDPTEVIDIEDSLLLKAALAQNATSTGNPTSGFGLTNVGFLSLFQGDTVAVGDSLETGNVTLGANGPINIGSTNLIIETQGTITGLGTVTSTGIVNSLIALLGPGVPPVTSGEIDPTSGSGTNTGLGDETDKKHLGESVGGTGGQPAGTVSGDSGAGGVCH